MCNWTNSMVGTVTSLSLITYYMTVLSLTSYSFQNAVMIVPVHPNFQILVHLLRYGRNEWWTSTLMFLHRFADRDIIPWAWRNLTGDPETFVS